MKIILWRLGSLEHEIFPNKMAVERFKHIITNLLDSPDTERHLVWGPDVDVKVVDIAECNFDHDSFDIRALLTENGVHIIESVKEVPKQYESNN